MQYPRSRLLIFTKAPVAGQVKTRLIPALGAVAAAELQCRLTHRLLASLQEAALCPLEVWGAPDVRREYFHGLKARYGVALRQQVEGDLGQRMAAASADALQRAEHILLIGVDCPLLGPALIGRALAALSRYDAVLGPVDDGGYALLGVKRYEPLLFQGVHWSAACVAEQTRRRMRRLAWDWLELPRLWDLDRPADLSRLYALMPELRSDGPCDGNLSRPLR